MHNSDLDVSVKSDALRGVNVDLVVSGSIGAVESVRLARALRRLGAKVYPYLTTGGAQFITKMALEWASAQEVVTEFNGRSSHLASHDLCLIAPCSANFVSSMANGLTSTAATALLASYLGQKKPVFLVPNMHNSLMDSPVVKENLDKVAKIAHVFQGRLEEGKNKFPPPDTLADSVSHHYHQITDSRLRGRSTLLTMGTTRGYVDEIRYFSNYSSGRLGSALAEELYRQGVKTDIVCGPVQVMPRSYEKLTQIETNEDMLLAVQRAVAEGCHSAVFMASVLDFIPAHKAQGKIKSDATLHVEFVSSKKIIGEVNPNSGIKIGFKLESSLTQEQMRDIAAHYCDKYSLSHLVFNLRSQIDEHRHIATIAERKDTGEIIFHEGYQTREDLARYLTALIKQSFE
jgi:phosphopantothenoylcysteine decarboxylase/phosphopantothenate--cysteine ligase